MRMKQRDRETRKLWRRETRETWKNVERNDGRKNGGGGNTYIKRQW